MTDLRKVEPLNDGIVVELIPAPEGRIIVPQIANERPHLGRVIAVGPGRRSKRGRRIPVSVALGEVIWFSLHDLEQNGLALIREGDVGFIYAD